MPYNMLEVTNAEIIAKALREAMDHELDVTIITNKSKYRLYSVTMRDDEKGFRTTQVHSRLSEALSRCLIDFSEFTLTVAPHIGKTNIQGDKK